MKTIASTATPRQIAVSILERFDIQASKKGKRHVLKASALLSDVSMMPGWTDQDFGLLRTLVFGVLRQWAVLDTVISALSRFPLSKLQPGVRTLLRLGLYQLRFMAHIPDYAAIDSTMETAKACRLSKKSIAFLHGVLREDQRRRKAGVFPEIPDSDSDPVGYLHLSFGWPVWLAERLLKQYSLAELEAMGRVSQEPSPLTLRVNLLKTNESDFEALLSAGGIRFHRVSQDGAACLVLEDFQGSPVGLPGYAEGYFMVQDASSAEAARWMAPHPGETVVDLCAAPGAKTTYMAAMMQNQGKIFALDPSEKRLAQLKENTDRLGVTNVVEVIADALQWSGEELPEKADRVLVDAPCSGLGTLRKHPEILVQMTPDQIDAYPAQQLALLEKGTALLKPGGVLVYSTCSLDFSENRGVVARFLEKHSGWALEEEVQRFITADYDGFYMARLQAPA